MIDKLQTTTSSSPTERANDIARLKQIQASTTINLPNHDTYISRILACKSELMAGNSYELCLTTTATTITPNLPHAPWTIYNSLRQHNPVPFAAFLHLHHTTILSSSPEQYLTWSATTQTLDMIPMKGTVKKTPTMTRHQATQLLSTPKESAENLMIADLIRHDLYTTVGRASKVEVVKLCDVIETETVYQLVSHIRAHAPPPPSPSPSPTSSTARNMTHHGLKALTHTLPPGSMTGAPKKRSCEILRRLEARPRGPYSGVIGYIDVSGNGGWSVAIRTAFSHDDHEGDANDDDNTENAAERPQRQRHQTWHIGAGGAITVLSDEEQEWEEMMTKLDSVLRAFRPS
jgi:para-aminobenzoate synthetase